MSVEDRVMETNSKAVRELTHVLPIPRRTSEPQKLFEKHREVVPTTTKYITASGKQALMLLQSAAALIPVPLITEAIGVALKIIEVCEFRKIPHRKGCEMLYNILFSENVCRRAKGQRAAR